MSIVDSSPSSHASHILDQCWRPPIHKPLGEPVIEVDSVSKSFKLVGRSEPILALSNITMKTPQSIVTEPFIYPIRRGEFVMIRGPSGGGKTTLLNIIGTLDLPTTGDVYVTGKHIKSSTSDAFLSKLRLENIAFVFQTFNLLPTQTAFENVLLPMTLRGKLTRLEREQRARLLLQRVGLGDRMDHLPSELSGGEQQRTAIARALANEPTVLLMDEPTGDLDTRATVEIMDLLLNINQRGFLNKETRNTAENINKNSLELPLAIDDNTSSSISSSAINDTDSNTPNKQKSPKLFDAATTEASFGLNPTAMQSQGLIPGRRSMIDSSFNSGSVPKQIIEGLTSGVTVVMVTHNPDLECYADRVLFVRDGTIEKQVINPIQKRLLLKPYVDFLNSIEEKKSTLNIPTPVNKFENPTSAAAASRRTDSASLPLQISSFSLKSIPAAVNFSSLRQVGENFNELLENEPHTHMVLTGLPGSSMSPNSPEFPIKTTHVSFPDKFVDETDEITDNDVIRLSKLVLRSPDLQDDDNDGDLNVSS